MTRTLACLLQKTLRFMGGIGNSVKTLGAAIAFIV